MKHYTQYIHDIAWDDDAISSEVRDIILTLSGNPQAHENEIDIYGIRLYIGRELMVTDRTMRLAPLLVQLYTDPNITNKAWLIECFTAIHFYIPIQSFFRKEDHVESLYKMGLELYELLFLHLDSFTNYLQHPYWGTRRYAAMLIPRFLLHPSQVFSYLSPYLRADLHDDYILKEIIYGLSRQFRANPHVSDDLQKKVVTVYRDLSQSDIPWVVLLAIGGIITLTSKCNSELADRGFNALAKICPNLLADNTSFADYHGAAFFKLSFRHIHDKQLRLEFVERQNHVCPRKNLPKFV